MILVLSQLKGIGAAFIKKNLSSIRQKHRWASPTTEKSIENFLALTNKKYSSLEIQEAVSKAEDILTECESNQIGFMSIVDEDYPRELLEIKDPPPVLFFVGNLSLLKIDAVTVIGTRKPNDNGKIIAERVGKYFASKGWAICNGLADGIDTFSILAQEKFCFAKVIGVVGSGLSSTALRSLPKQSVANIDHILHGEGLVLSEMPPSKKQDTFSVVKSCRIQAGIGKGIILIQSSLDGGSKFTVKAAVDSRRPLGVICPVKSDINREDYAANRRITQILHLSQ
ncbi:DNA-protecting protein DprA [Kovacikia minuta CCNUW1]|uniref:DNA-processing protein DprA n=1 Tax=Kovacikia minuta TaxID=2931930 RepID=UPI001CD03FCF|nr:DNA-processing protein DprA [Kovacikia minuta]UBF25988.1 DNA-protecting protein DprA [Kovacikia minuta CCNUW1]